MARRIYLPIIATASAVLAALVFHAACSQEPDGFDRVEPGMSISLPADHAAHPRMQNEWWYFTGHLRARDGRRFGFQMTWFRVGLARDGGETRATTVYFAHFAVTDKDAGTFRYHEKIARGGGYDDAGADARLLQTWIGNWRLERLGDMFYLSARTDSLSLALIGRPSKPAVLQGRNGYSRKGADPGNATMYYSLPRIAVAGVLNLDGEALEVDGTSWMDHEYGTSQLDTAQVGWDWFSLQLDNGEEVMLYGLRGATGSYDERSAGVVVASDGRATHLTREDYRIEVLERWKSPASGATYPSAWRITIPSRGLEFVVRPAVADQELRTENSARVTYWEGAVDLTGTAAGRPVKGEGYVELTGYAAPLRF